MRDFVHLHVHSQYSLLDGQASVKGLVDKALADGMRGIALTDHGNMFGIKEFWNYVKKKNAELSAEGKPKFKPIIGCEMYVANRSFRQKQSGVDIGGYHLIVLAKNETGYHNLIKLVSRAWTEGFYRHPRTDREELARYREGLIVASACLGGEVPRKITAGRLDEAEEAIGWYQKTFGSDYYLELQRHKATAPRANYEAYPMQQTVNKQLIEYSKKYGIKLICTNDVHFLNEENAEAHDRLICLSTGKDLNDEKRMVYTKQEWMKTREEMNLLFEDVPEALDGTVEICDKVEIYSIDHAPIMPTFAIPAEFGTEDEYRRRYSEQELYDEFTRDEHGNVTLGEEEGQKKIQRLGGYDKLYRIKLEADYLKKLTFEGARKRYGEELSDEVKERLDFELHIMKTMGFPGYFLIVQDFINAARNELGVSVGPGRGSAAGSAVAYCLGITQIDPIQYDLLFERFLNPDRISLPDIDVDFDDDGRGDVLRWVTEKYGQEKVAHIITYGTMATKMSLKDVARVEKVPLPESDRLAKLIPDRLPDGKKINLKNCIAAVPELQDACNSPDERVRNTMLYAQMLEGNVRGTGVHACGTIICRDDITDWVPVSTAEDKETKEKMLVTQYEGSVIEETGLIKMDFLGLKTLSIIKEALANIKEHTGKDIDIDHIPIDDPETYRLFSEGRTVGTFQFESAGMQKYLRELKPTTFEDLIAMNALYRPGPMDYIPSFINRKHGRETIQYDIPVMEKYLKDTYGITVYQEQVMLLSRLLADFTRGESDALRKAMGTKLRDKLDHMKPKFIEGGKANGYDPKVLEKIWGDWEKFASYAFNKSHATCYSWVAYQTAYLKAHYPAEFMAANLSRNISRIDELTKLMDECKAMGIKVLGPDINESNLKFTVNSEGNIRFGLGAIKSVGEAAVEDIIEKRKKGGPFKSIYDVVERVNLSVCNRKMLECMALAGTFDSFRDIRRHQFFNTTSKGDTFSELLVRYGMKYQSDQAANRNSLFGEDEAVAIAHPVIPEGEEWSSLEELNKEKEYVGLYLSAHPLDEYSVILNHVCNARMIDIQPFTRQRNLSPLPEGESLRPLAEGQELSMGGIVTNVVDRISKNNNPFLIGTVEDYSGSAEFALFGEDYVKFKSYFMKGLFLYIRGTLQSNRWNKEILELKITSVDLLPSVCDRLVEKITIATPLSRFEEAVACASTCKEGEAALSFVVTDDVSEANPLPTLTLAARKKRIKVDRNLIKTLRENDFAYGINEKKAVAS